MMPNNVGRNNADTLGKNHGFSLAASAGERNEAELFGTLFLSVEDVPRNGTEPLL
jgi:hypothetical protein